MFNKKRLNALEDQLQDLKKSIGLMNDKYDIISCSQGSLNREFEKFESNFKQLPRTVREIKSDQQVLFMLVDNIMIAKYKKYNDRYIQILIEYLDSNRLPGLKDFINKAQDMNIDEIVKDGIQFGEIHIIGSSVVIKIRLYSPNQNELDIVDTLISMGDRGVYQDGGGDEHSPPSVTFVIKDVEK